MKKGLILSILAGLLLSGCYGRGDWDRRRSGDDRNYDRGGDYRRDTDRNDSDRRSDDYQRNDGDMHRSDDSGYGR